MKRIFYLTVIAAILTGCRTPDKAFVEGVDATWSVIGPEYRAYLERDASLDAEARKIKLGTAAALTRLIEEAKKSTEQAPAPTPAPPGGGGS